MNSGNRSVSGILLLLATLVATDAGRVGESGSGAMRVAPGFVRTSTEIATPCQATNARSREIVFEMIEPGDDAAMALIASREIVRFEWRPETGELVYDTAAVTSLFDDLLTSHAVETSNCRSR